MGIFIQGDNFDRPGGKAEEEVWKKLKEALSSRDILAYSRYPMFEKVGEKRKEPDILILDKEEGLIIIEVKAYTIGTIENIEANKWILRNSYERTANPIAQAEDYLYSIKSKFDSNRELRGKYKGKYFVAIPNITKAEWEKFGFDKKTNGAPIIFKDYLSKIALTNLIENTQSTIGGYNLDKEGYRIAQAILGHERNYISDVDYSLPEGTKARIYSEMKNRMHDLDIQQESIAKVIAPGPQRIRGIAGSGKTELICQRAAIMSLRYPEWKIAVVFFTQSLYDTIINTIDKYIRAFSNGTSNYSESSNLKILHAWGNKNRNGFYREVANRNNCIFRSAGDVKKDLGRFIEFNNSINYVAKKLLEETKENIEGIFDAILIDEGQDLVGDDEFKYEGKQAFYYMAYKSLKPIGNEDLSLRRLTWAYDELQSLSDKKIPSGRELFGDASIVSGIYKGGIQKCHVMKKCYRTPSQILTTAHAIGMGIFRDKGMLSGYTQKKDWERVGYNVIDGKFKDGNQIIIERPIENSPNPIKDFYNGSCIEFQKFNNEYDMIKELAANIKDDVEKQKLNPSKDILIINLKDLDFNNDYDSQIGEALNKVGINFYIPSYSSMNTVVKPNWRDLKPEMFWMDNAITISKTPRAKGNEAPMVYVIGVEEIAKNEDKVSYRNKLFTAITRAKCWTKIMGVGSYLLYEEIEKAINSNGVFRFKYTRPKNQHDDAEVDD